MSHGIERKNPDTTREPRRRGSAFDTLGHVIRDVRELLFRQGFVIRNRPGTFLGEENNPLETGFIKVFNMVEAYYTKAPSVAKGINALIFGREGTGRYRNTSVIELTAKHVTEISNDLGPNNGSVKLRVTRDDEDPSVDNAGITVADAGTLGTGLDGIVTRVTGTGESGGVTIAHISDREENPSAATRKLRFLDDSIRLEGIPSSDPGIEGALFYSTVNGQARCVRVSGG